MSSKKAAFQQRQLQIARERGLISDNGPKEGVIVQKRKAYQPYVKDAPKNNHQVPEPEPCPCASSGLSFGRHQVPGGWCVEGVFWPHSALGTMKAVKALYGEESMLKLKKALELVNEHIPLDLSQLKNSHVS